VKNVEICRKILIKFSGESTTYVTDSIFCYEFWHGENLPALFDTNKKVTKMRGKYEI